MDPTRLDSLLFWLWLLHLTRFCMVLLPKLVLKEDLFSLTCRIIALLLLQVEKPSSRLLRRCVNIDGAVILEGECLSFHLLLWNWYNWINFFAHEKTCSELIALRMSAEINVEEFFFLSGSARPPYYINYGNAHIIYEQEILVLCKSTHMIVPFSFPDSKRHTQIG